MTAPTSTFARIAGHGPRPRVGRAARRATHDLLVLRPLGGTDDETAALLPALEAVAAGHLPTSRPSTTSATPHRAGCSATPCGSAFRSTAGPFRSFGRRSRSSPAPYQLVPLLMALKQDPSGC